MSLWTFYHFQFPPKLLCQLFCNYCITCWLEFLLLVPIQNKDPKYFRLNTKIIQLINYFNFKIKFFPLVYSSSSRKIWGLNDKMSRNENKNKISKLIIFVFAFSYICLFQLAYFLITKPHHYILIAWLGWLQLAFRVLQKIQSCTKFFGSILCYGCIYNNKDLGPRLG